MQVIHGDDISVAAWGSVISGNRFASPFQSYEFYRLINSVSGLSASATAVCIGEEILALVVITFQKSRGVAAYFSRRAIIYGGPLADPKHPEALEILINSLEQEIRGKAIYAETRNLSDYSIFREIFVKHRWEYLPYVNFIVRTGNYDEMTRTVSASRMRNIKNARNAGVTWKKAGSLEDVGQLYALLKNLYRKKVRKPLLPWDFFRQFFEMQAGVILLVLYQEKVIGGIVCPVMEGKTLYEFYVCGLDSEYKMQSPSIMATWAALEYATENGIQKFDFMGAGRSDEDYGVRDFKARFGGEMIEYGRFRRVLKPFLYRVGEMIIKFRTDRKK